ncbi:MAG: Acetyl-CoA decarbonylase/synthase complex subunit epsilon 2 [Methanonatronarchaeales archaeon]|nr:Acetyl-CoA decarbonylase/synthase complex subunit epsilon 2 [Methanonatronarchaeales archaeon]
MTQAHSPGNVRVKPGADLNGAMLGKLLNRPGTLFLVGSQWKELPDGVLEPLVDGGDVILTGSANPPVEKVARMGVSEACHLLCSEGSLGGEYGQVVFVGIPHHIATGMLSKLKHYSDATAISLDRGFQPDANLAFPNLSREDWEEELGEAVERRSA